MLFFEDRTNIVTRVSRAIWPRQPSAPWLARDAMQMLDERLDGRQVGLEWGSGKGTLWLLERSLWLTSVEHQRARYERVKASLDEAGVTNSDYRLVAEAHYLRAVDEIPPGSLDYVIIDGLFRDETTKRSMQKLKSGGWLVVDDVNWYLPSSTDTPQSRTWEDGAQSDLWTRIAREFTTWETRWFTNDEHDTAIFVKP